MENVFTDGFTMEVNFDPDTGVILAAYFRFREVEPNSVKHTEPISDFVFVDLDENDEVIGVEIVDPTNVTIKVMKQAAETYQDPRLGRIRPKMINDLVGA